MSSFKFPKLELNQWKNTRDSIQQIAKIMGEIRVNYTQKQKHWYHVNVRPSINGFSTTLLHQDHNTIFELEYHFNKHQLVVSDYQGNHLGISPKKKTVSSFAKEVSNAVKEISGTEPNISDSILNNSSEIVYNDEHATNYYRAFLEISIVLKAFKHSFNEETSAVQLWPDHFDLALLWFSGNKVDGIDPDDKEHADEQMNFGFSTGDEGIPEAYIYITAYPLPHKMKNLKVPAPIQWHDMGFKGFAIKYNELIQDKDPAQLLYNSLEIVQKETSKRMSK